MLRKAFLIVGNALMAGTLGLLINNMSRLRSLPIFGMMGVSYVVAAHLTRQSPYLGIGAALLVACYVSAFPPAMLPLLPLFVLLPLALLLISGFVLRRREATLPQGNALTYVAHLTAGLLVGIVLWPEAGASEMAGLLAALAGVLLYASAGVAKREGSHILGFVLLSVVFFQRVLVVLGLPRIPIFLALLLVPLLITIFLVTPRNRKLAEWLYASLISVALSLSVYVTFGKDIVTSGIVFAVCGVSYVLMGMLVRRGEYVYLLTLTLGLFALNRVMSSADLFIWQLVSIFVYIIAGIGLVMLGLLLARAIRYRRPFSILIARNVLGAVILLGPVLLLVLIGLGSYSLRATENPLFCATCHNMKSQFVAWRESLHSNVPCTSCHRTPGLEGFVEEKMTGIVETVKYATGQYIEKSHAQVDDESCTSKCHPRESLRGRILRKDGVKFDHEVHVEIAPAGLTLKCTSCHTHVREGEHFGVNAGVCFQCHFHGSELSAPAFGSCTTCHDIPEKAVGSGDVSFEHTDLISTGKNVRCTYCHANATVGKGDVQNQACRLCHLETTIANSEESDIHEVHVTNFKVECVQCHGGIEHGKDAARVVGRRGMTGYCSSCHGVPFKAAALLYSGNALKNAEGTPDPMFEAGVKCNGCHRFESGKMASSLASCGDCHGTDSGYADLVVAWQSDISELARETGKLIEEALRMMDAAGKKAGMVKNLTDYATSARNAVLLDGSNGAHNYMYSSWLLETARDSVSVAIRILREEP